MPTWTWISTSWIWSAKIAARHLTGQPHLGRGGLNGHRAGAGEPGRRRWLFNQLDVIAALATAFI